MKKFVHPWNDYDTFADHYNSNYGPYSEEFIHLILKICQLEGGPVLDLACGAGRSMLELLKAGLQVTGVDISEKMLQLCKENIMAKYSGEFNLHQQALQELDLNEKSFSTAICFISLQYMNNYQELDLCLKKVNSHLKDNGLFFIEHSNLSRKFQELITSQKTEVLISLKKTDAIIGNVYEVVQSKYFPQENSIGFRSYEKKSKLGPEEFSRSITLNCLSDSNLIFSTKNLIIGPKEFEEHLEASGFRVLKTFGDLSMKAFDPERDTSLFVLSEKVRSI